MTAEARRPLPWRRWALDAVVVTVFLTATLGSNAHENYDVRIAGAALLAAAVLLYRHRQPLAVLALLTGISVAVTAMGPGLASFDLGVAFAVYAVARAHPARVAWPAAAASVAILAVALAIWAVAADGTVKAHGGFIITGATSGLAAVATPLVIFTLIALTAGAGVRVRRERITGLVNRANQLALERDQREQLAVATERTRIAREMHDVVAHSLTVMIALSEGAAASFARDPERATQALTEVAATGRAALADMRRVVGALRDPGESGDLLVVGSALRQIEDLVTRVRAAGIPTALTIQGPELPEDAGLHLSVYRIVQESLTNVLRHAPRSPGVSVQLDIDDAAGTVTIDVTNVAGPPTETVTAGSGHGIIGMRERAAVHGGDIEAGPTHSGWRVHALLNGTWE